MRGEKNVYNMQTYPVQDLVNDLGFLYSLPGHLYGPIGIRFNFVKVTARKAFGEIDGGGKMHFLQRPGNLLTLGFVLEPAIHRLLEDFYGLFEASPLIRFLWQRVSLGGFDHNF